MTKLEKSLRSCPLCDGRVKAEVVEVETHYTRTKIRCTGCGLLLNWEQDFAVCEFTDPVTGAPQPGACVALNESAEERWNKRRPAKWVRWVPSAAVGCLIGAKELYTCSKCTAKFGAPSNFCPYCGAEMENPQKVATE